MRYLAFATDHDGTIAHKNVVDDLMFAAFKRLKDSGFKLILRPGENLTSYDRCAHASLFSIGSWWRTER